MSLRVSKLVSKLKYQNLTNALSFDTIGTITPAEKKKLLKAKIAVALHDELGRVPKKVLE
jgi:hypothetical protein